MRKKRLQKIRKGTPSYRMGYRWKDIKTGREFWVHPFGYEGVYVSSKSKRAFCKHLRETITDEKKAYPDYKKLGKQGKKLGFGFVQTVTNSNAEDEKKHKRKDMALYSRICKR